MKYCEICDKKNEFCACKYNPRELLVALSDCLDNFEFDHLSCPADYLVFSDVHEQFIELRYAINSALSMYDEE